MSPSAGLSAWPSPRRPPPARPPRCPGGRVYKGLASTTTSCRCQTEPAVSCRSRPQLQLRARVTSGSCDDSQLSQLMKSAVPRLAAVAGLAWVLQRAGAGWGRGGGGSAERGQTLLELGPGSASSSGTVPSSFIIGVVCRPRPAQSASFSAQPSSGAVSATSKAFSSLLGGAGPRHTATTSSRNTPGGDTPTHHRCGPGLCAVRCVLPPPRPPGPVSPLNQRQWSWCRCAGGGVCPGCARLSRVTLDFHSWRAGRCLAARPALGTMPSNKQTLALGHRQTAAPARARTAGGSTHHPATFTLYIQPSPRPACKQSHPAPRGSQVTESPHKRR